MKKIFTFLSAAVACLALTACNDPMKGDFLHTDNTISAIYMLPATGSSSVSISGKIDNEAGTIQFTIPRAKRKEIDRAAVKLRANVALDAYVTPPLTGIHNLEILINSSQKEGIHVVLSGVNPKVQEVLLHAGVDKIIGSDHICDHITKAVAMANKIANRNDQLQEVTW